MQHQRTDATSHLRPKATSHLRPNASSEHRSAAQPTRRTTRAASLGIAAALVGALAAPAFAAPAGAPSSPGYTDTVRDGAVDAVVLVDPQARGAHSAAGSLPPRPVIGVRRGAPTSPTLAKLDRQLAAAKVSAAKAGAAQVRAQRAAAALARSAQRASATARTARQRAHAAKLARQAAAAAKAARMADAKARSARSLVSALKKTIDTINRVNRRKPAPTTPATPPTPTRPTAPTKPPTPTRPPAPVTTAGCDTLAATFRPVQVSWHWQVSCVDAFPGITVEAGFMVLGLTRYDGTQNLAQVMVLRSLTGRQLTATLAHELAHAYSITSMTSTQRAFFVNRLRAARLTTATDFFQQSVSYDRMPAEIWARTQATCLGYPAPDSGFTEASCADVVATQAAR